MGLFVVIFSALLLSGFCRGGPAVLPPGTGSCWVMGNLHSTFDGHYYTFMGNCSYTMAKNCQAGGKIPGFNVETRNVNIGSLQVPTVGSITVTVYGINIEIVRSEIGFVRVNFQKWNLPMSLNDGQVKLYQRGLYVVMETDFGLTVQYDWDQYVFISVPDSFSGGVCGLCGDFNGNKEDDLETPGDWRVPGANDGPYCRDKCVGKCENCTLSTVQELENLIFCGALIQNFEEMSGCQPDIDPKVFQSNCMKNLCLGENLNSYLCSTLQSFADICQRSGAKVPDWRTSSKCPTPKVPANSHYEFCGSGCPVTCANPDVPAKCNATCVETWVCNEGFVRSGIQCVPKAQCGCVYQGHYLEAGAFFWGDQTCTERFTCSAGGSLASKKTSCTDGLQCRVVEGMRGCYPVDYGTCMVSGDPHFVTFDGDRYNFQGTCVYELAEVSSNRTGLEHFSVVLQNNGRDKRIGSMVKLVEVKVYEYTIGVSKDQPGAVVVNGYLTNLPLTLDDGKLQLYSSGWFAVIQTDFGVKVYYDWNSVAFVMVPVAFRGAMQGLCGNYNLDPADDMRMRNGEQAATPEDFGQSWKIANISGCVDGCVGPCPGCNSTQRATYNSSSYCGLIGDPKGPFRDCHLAVDPAGFLYDCLFDVCLYQGKGNMQCKTLTAYTAACQLKGAPVYSWRSAQFCDAQNPPHSHYELCTTGCPRYCQTDSAPSTASTCAAQCMEGFVCDEGFLRSGDGCVSAEKCGCTFEGKYYHDGQVFYPDSLCQRECTCNSTVQCKTFSCGPHETCEVRKNVRSCQAFGKAVCSVSGDPHYNTFDNATYDFQGTCTYVAAEACYLTGTQLAPFSVAVENEKWYGLSNDPKVSAAKLVAVEVYGAVIILRRNELKMVWINGLLHHLPQNLHDGAVKVYQEGSNDVITTDFGLRVTYDLVYHVTVTVPGNYSGRTCGLCGNFNHNATDDLQLPGGKPAENVQSFGAAWKVSVPGATCDDGCSGDLCPKCADSKKAALEAKCSVITDPKGPFSACHDVIDPGSYFRNCVYDVCMAEDDRSMLCQSIAAYMLDCQDFGAKIQNWRSPTFCPFNCSAGSHYETCVLPCTSPCPGLLDTISCSQTCVEGCACDGGYHYNGTGCVPFDQCSCYYKGQTYKIGESLITDDCHRIHTCQASGVVISRNMSCDPNESCLAKNGVLGCYVQQCLLGANGFLTTFNGEGGTVTMPGAYEIIQNCDKSQTSDWFRVVVKLEMCTAGINSITGVYVFFSEVVITLNKNHLVWVNGRPMNQTAFLQNNVKVLVSDNTVSINSTSTLQLLFSSSNKLVISVSDKVSDMVCGACGKLKPINSTQRGLRERLLSLRYPSSALASMNIRQWTAPDFPQC